MLSKSHARLFFLSATGGFSLVFLGLTVDTLRQVPARTHSEAITAEVVHGKELWESNNCMGCHTLLGEGAYYAPELTKVVERRGKEWMRIFLRDPQAMFPGERKMVQYDFTEDEITALISFFEWVGNINTNGFPAKPDLVAPTTTAAASPALEAPETFKSVCVACHSVKGNGGQVGPALDTVGQRYTVASMDAWLADPQSVKPGTTMPNLNLPPETRQELVTWLLTLQ
jgi:nitric oxide reductase subunit C